jgi:predicted metal-dependent phosphoesterase TrpH
MLVIAPTFSAVVPLKVELHAHTSDDPTDPIPHTSQELIDRAAELGYQALAITLHDKQVDLEPLRDHAARHGIVLIPGVERSIQAKHVLLLNFTRAAAEVKSFDDLAELKSREPHGLVVAPHPFYPLASCMRDLMDHHASAIDAVEYNGMYASGLNFNKAAVRWAAARGKPLVGNCDVHRLAQLGTTYSLVDAEPEPQSICDAIRAGHVEVRTTPLSWYRLVTILGDILVR